MKNPGKVLLVVLGALVGGALGVLLGVQIPFVVCVLLDKRTGTSWVQVGWVFLFLTVPAGATLGCWLGGVGMALRPRLFALAVAPVILAEGGYYYLTEIFDRPRSYVVRVTGEPGRRFVGAVMTDGENHALRGTLPAQFEYHALRVGLAFAPADSYDAGAIVLEVLVEGTAPAPAMRSEIGVKGDFQSHGYAEWGAKTTSSLWAMDPAEANDLRNNPFEGLRSEPAR